MTSACATAAPPPTLGEDAASFGYVPLDGLAIRETECQALKEFALPEGERIPVPLVEALPDITVRFAVASTSTDGGLSFGPAKVTAKGSTYKAVLDYVNVDAWPVDFLLRKVVESGSDRPDAIAVSSRTTRQVLYFEARIEPDPATVDSLVNREAYEEVTIPIYIGIGVRLTADLKALKSGIALTSLGGIAANAQTDDLAGTLTVQTIGISGRSVSAALPLPSKLDQTTIEQSILALGSARTSIYADAGDVKTTPRVVGLYSPVGSDPRLINAIYSALARSSDWAWRRPCQTGDS